MRPFNSYDWIIRRASPHTAALKNEMAKHEPSCLDLGQMFGEGNGGV